MTWRLSPDGAGRPIGKDTTLCISIAARPSNIGTRFHNYLYAELGLDFLYKAFAPTDAAGAIAGVRSLGIRGCSVSMPFKEDCLSLVDEVEASARGIGSVNTIVNDDGRLTAHNTDFVAVAALLDSLGASTSGRAAVAGSGGMAKAVVAALREAGYGDVVVVARNEPAGRALADQYGFAWSGSLDGSAALLVNATPVGMTGGAESDASPFDQAAVEAADAVFDVVAMPARTPLIALAEAAGKPAVTGADVIALQAAEQFALYTGVRPTRDQIERASAFSQQPGEEVSARTS